MIRRTLTLALAVGLLTTVTFVSATAANAAPTRPAGCAAGFPSYRAAPVATGGTTTSVRIPMSDGVALRADVTIPNGIAGPFPTSLTITGYNKAALGSAGAGPMVNHGYATVLVDDRGTGASPGNWDAWGERTVKDYAEVLDWITARSWSDGKVGVTGTSYMAITALRAAATHHPAVKAVFAIVPMADAYRDIVFGGGQPNTVFIPAWMGLVSGAGLPTTDDPATLIDHAAGLVQFQVPTLVGAAAGGPMAYDGPFWRQRSPIEFVDQIAAPTFIVGGLDDIFQRGEPLLYEHLADHVDARLLIGPWSHLSATQGLPRDGVPSVNTLLLQWFDQHVRGRAVGAECIPAVTQYVRGHERYESSTSWPVPSLRSERWFLRGNGGLSTAAPGPTEVPMTYSSLSPTGLCSRSTSQWLIGALDQTPCATDNRLGEMGALTYTSLPFATEQEINGPIQADIWITSDRTEATVSVAVSDVAPDGTSRGLSNGVLLASHRAVDPARARVLDGQSIQPWHPFTEGAQQRLTPGVPTLLPIEVFPTSAAIAPGHRLRITVAPYDPIHGLPSVAAALDSVGGTVTILNDATHPSSVVFPVVAATPKVVAQSTNVSALFVGAERARTAVLVW